MPRILILNSGRGPNKGDHAILGSQLEHITNNIKESEIRHLPVLPGKWDFFYFFRLIKWSEIVVIGGGQMLRDDTSLLVIPLLCYRVLVAKLFSRKVMFYGIGAGPIKSTVSRILLRRIISLSNLISVREKFSYDLLQQLGVPVSKLTLSADPALAFSAASQQRAEDILEELGLLNKKIIAITPRRAFYFRHKILPMKYLSKLGLGNSGVEEQALFERNLVGLCDDLTNKGYFILFIAMTTNRSGDVQGENDDAIAKRIACRCADPDKVMILDEKYSAAEIKAILAFVELLLAMRMHSTILACMQGALVSAIGINVKFYQFFKRLNLSSNVIDPVDSLDPDTLKARIFTILENKDALKAQMSRCLAQLRTEEHNNIIALKKLIYGD